MRKRGGRSGIILLCTLLFALIGAQLASAFILSPEQPHTIPFSIQIEYSTPIIVQNATLQNVQTGAAVRTYPSSSFTKIDDGKTYTLAVDQILPGVYDLVIDKIDPGLPGKPQAQDTVRFEYLPIAAVFDITLSNLHRLNPTAGVSPYAAGFAQTTPFNVTFTTSKPAWCKYTTSSDLAPERMIPFTQTGTQAAPVTSHAIRGVFSSAEISPVSVWCSSAYGNITKGFTLGYETVAPNFTFTLFPPTIVDPTNVSARLTIAQPATPRQPTPQKIFCEAIGATSTVTSGASFEPERVKEEVGAYIPRPTIDFRFTEQPTSPVNKTFAVTCTNRAGLSATKSLTVPIALNLEPTITLISPPRYTRETAPKVRVQVLTIGVPVAITSCTFINDAPAALEKKDELTWGADFPSMGDAQYNYTVECVLPTGKVLRRSIMFSVDAHAPPGAPARLLVVPPRTCGIGDLTASINLSDDTLEDPNFAGYATNITYPTGNVQLFSGETRSEELVASFATQIGKTYRWHVWPFDLAQNYATELSGDTIVIPANDTRCDVTPPTPFLAYNRTPGITHAILSCDDGDGSGCAPQFLYDILPSNTTAADCTYTSTETLGRPLSFYENKSFCYLVSDRNANNATGYRLVAVNATVPPPSSFCNNDAIDVAYGETGVDCGGPCDPCGDGSACSTGRDCTSGYCNETLTCAYTSCTDKTRNGYESDIDCGGSCPACDVGENCEGKDGVASNANCASGSCDPTDGTCAQLIPVGSSCTSDVDCGGGTCSLASFTCVNVPLNRPCTAETDCGEGMCDGEKNVCVEKVPLGRECTYDKECNLGRCDPETKTCVEQEQPETLCGDVVCGYDEECLDDVCVPSQVPEPDAEPPSLLGIILIILGVLTICGCSYWLYVLHAQRAEESAAQAAASTPTVAYAAQQQELSPEQRMALIKRRQEQIDALHGQQQAVAQQRASTKAAVRAAAFKGLDDTKGAAPADAASANADGTKPVEPSEGDADDGFVDIATLDKQALPEQEETQPKKKTAAKTAAFSDLDSLIDDKKQ